MSSLKLGLAFFLGLEHFDPLWRHRSVRPWAPVRPVSVPVRPVDVVTVFLILSCPPSVEVTETLGITSRGCLSSCLYSLMIKFFPLAFLAWFGRIITLGFHNARVLTKTLLGKGLSSTCISWNYKRPSLKANCICRQKVMQSLVAWEKELWNLQYEDHVWFEDRWMVASLCDEWLTMLCGLILG
jgi:hypothetical protein